MEGIHQETSRNEKTGMRGDEKQFTLEILNFQLHKKILIHFNLEFSDGVCWISQNAKEDFRNLNEKISFFGPQSKKRIQILSSAIQNSFKCTWNSGNCWWWKNRPITFVNWSIDKKNLFHQDSLKKRKLLELEGWP